MRDAVVTIIESDPSQLRTLLQEASATVTPTVSGIRIRWPDFLAAFLASDAAT
jgi:hypothetical protein